VGWPSTQTWPSFDLKPRGCHLTIVAGRWQRPADSLRDLGRRDPRAGAAQREGARCSGWCEAEEGHRRAGTPREHRDEVTGEIRLAALCDHALVGQDGKVSLLGIFRNISVSALPAQHPRMFLVAILGLEVGQHTVVVRLLKPDGQQAMPNPPEISVHASAGQDVNVIVELNNMNFTTYGSHRFQLSVDGEAVGDLPVAIVQMQPPGERRRSN
jgi:hypothetical protein